MKWSLRDLRTVAINARLNDELDGTYDATSRLWTFRSREVAERAEALAQAQTLYLLHIPGGSRLYDSLTSEKWGGVAISSPNEEGSKRRGVATFIFRDEEHYTDARRYATGILRSTNTLEGLERACGARAEVVFGMTREELAQRFATGAVSEYQEAVLNARLQAFVKRTPTSAAAESSSLSDAFAMADDWLASIDRKLPHVTQKAPRGTLEGVIAGRSAHHVVIDDGEQLIGLRSDTIATPKRQQFDQEITFDWRSPVNIAFDDRSIGHAIQNRDRDDLDFALLKLRGTRQAAARGEDAILMHDENYRGDYDLLGTCIAKRGSLAAIYDNGAVLAITDDPHAEVGAILRKGPRATALRAPARAR